MDNYIILQDDYQALASTHYLWTRNRDRWEFYYNSYAGGDDYRDGKYLTRYQLETNDEYGNRLLNTPLDNQCQSVIQTYISFLFREPPIREFESWAGNQALEDFVKDTDFEGRDIDTFMKQVAIWSSVFGHCWIVVSKGNIGAETQAQELAAGLRPYAACMSPLTVSDWRWARTNSGRYELVYLKYVEEVIDKLTTVKEWTKEVVRTIVLDDTQRQVRSITTLPNQLGEIPAVLVYNKRSIYKDLGISDLTDIADLQRQLYNLISENEQAIRLEGHPTLVVPAGETEIGSGAGAIIQVQANIDAGLKPYFLSTDGGSVDSIHKSMDKIIEAIDRIAFTSGVRTTRTQAQSGISLEVEFSLLNAKLAEKADNLELGELNMWRLFGLYQGLEWDGEVKYPDSYNIRDDVREIQQLVAAKNAATDPRVLQVIDHEIIELLGEDADLIMPEYVATEAANFPPKPLFEAHTMYNPETGEEVIARTEQEHIAYMEQGYIHKEED